MGLRARVEPGVGIAGTMCVRKRRAAVWHSPTPPSGAPLWYQQAHLAKRNDLRLLLLAAHLRPHLLLLLSCCCDAATYLDTTATPLPTVSWHAGRCDCVSWQAGIVQVVSQGR